MLHWRFVIVDLQLDRLLTPQSKFHLQPRTIMSIHPQPADELCVTLVVLAVDCTQNMQTIVYVTNRLGVLAQVEKNGRTIAECARQ
jgi:hypothetical protein